MGQVGHQKGAVVDGYTMPGTKPEDLQAFIGAQFINSGSNPIVSGGVVTGTGGLTYNVSAGVGLMRTAFGAFPVTWAAGATKLVQTPSTTRTDVVVVDAGGQFDVNVESSFDESKYIVLDRRILPAGATATSRSTSDKRRNYAIPYGGNLGWFGGYGEYRSGTVPAPERVVEIPFWVPTDRFVDLKFQQAIFGAGGTTGGIRYQAFLDNVLLVTFELDFVAGYVVRHFPFDAVPVSVGDHKLRVERVSKWGGNATFFGGGSEKLAGGFVGIRDAGVQQ